METKNTIETVLLKDFRKLNEQEQQNVLLWLNIQLEQHKKREQVNSGFKLYQFTD